LDVDFISLSFPPPPTDEGISELGVMPNILLFVSEPSGLHHFLLKIAAEEKSSLLLVHTEKVIIKNIYRI